MTEEEAREAYLVQRPYLGKICHSISFFQCLGNHENEEGWNFDVTFAAPDQSLAIDGMKYRKLFYPTPVPDNFYSGEDIPILLSEGTGSSGFTEGHPFILGVRDAASNAQCPAETEIIKGTGTFRKHESTFVRFTKSAVKRAGISDWPLVNYLNIYPIPTTGIIYFHADSPTSERVHLQVISAGGQKVIDRYFNTIPGEIDISGNSSGLYTIRLTGDSGCTTEKIVLMK